MGVPRLFPWIKRNFYKYIRHFEQHTQPPFIVDALYLDSNPLIYDALSIVYNSGGKHRMLDIYKDLSKEEKIFKIYELFFESIINLTKIVTPRKLLYIAIDGPAPRAKQNQQRVRRYVGDIEIVKEEERLKQAGEKVDLFNKSQITPGTLFMHNLMKYINFSIRKELNQNKDWQNVKIIFSSCTSPGEGEHKILEYIRNIPEHERNEDHHCIFGPDGDLIILTMATYLKNMSLFKEDQYNPGYYYWLSMGDIALNLPDQLSQHHRRGLKDQVNKDVVNDFIVQGFFVGNDFLPKIQMFHFLEDGLELMIKTYQHTSKQSFLTVQNKLNIEGFKLFVREISKYEVQYLIEQIITKDPKKLPPSEEFVNYSLKNCISEREIRETGEYVYSLDMDMYRENYYSKMTDLVFGTDEFREFIKNVCFTYLKSFIWILEYYIIGLPSWGWAYTYHYAPLLTDFNEYIQNLSEEDKRLAFKFDIGEPSMPFEQLLSITPPNSANLLPKVYQQLLLNPNSPMVTLKYYPSVVKIDFEGKRYDHEGITDLPFVDYKVVHKNYDELTELCVKDVNKFHRNRINKESIFSYDSKKSFNYNSQYGNLENIHVVRNVVL